MNSSLRRFFRAVGLAASGAFVLLILLVVWTTIRWYAPPLRIAGEKGSALIDVSTLREYPTTVIRIRLSEASNSTVLWELNANGVAQIRGFTLVKGQNPSNVKAEYGEYTVLTPQNSAAFILRSRTKYKIELWGGKGFVDKTSAVFTLSD